jgi:hypothetical protein
MARTKCAAAAGLLPSSVTVGGAPRGGQRCEAVKRARWSSEKIVIALVWHGEAYGGAAAMEYES